MFFPVILDLLRDNLMQSEMACHIGMCGRKYCRTCHAVGTKGLKVPGDDDEGSDMGDELDPDLDLDDTFDQLNLDLGGERPHEGPSIINASSITQPIGENP